ncbi:MAG TPA: hypothetical protein VEH07_01645, partial [Alphaproteobacteria bacterium]|nr:hypothetical protein [Alphaproteobacteria bacterium]
MLPFSITGVLARSRLQIRAIIFAAIIGAAGFALWTAVSLTSANIADTCSPRQVAPSLGELLHCGFFWSRALAVTAIAFALTLLARGLTFYADGIFGRTSLNLFSNSFAITVLAAVLLAAPIELNLQFSSFAFVQPFKDAVMSQDNTRIYATSHGAATAIDTSTGRRLSAVEIPPFPDPRSSLSDGRTVSIDKSSDKSPAVIDDGADGSRFILGSADCTDTSSAGLCNVNFVSVSPDGTHILTASNDGIARVWDGAGAEIMALKGHRDRVYSARYSPDGRFIITTSADRTIAVW